MTENGYNYTPATGSLNLKDPAVQHDLAQSNSPGTPIGQIVRGLQLRARTHAEPVTILSCDNLADNGHHTQRLVPEFASMLPAAEAAETAAWIDSHVSFPSSMVDRIVPATTDHYRKLVAQQRGYTDLIPVPAEPFTMWIVEDNFIAGRPAWEEGGAVFSNDVAGYEQLKVRLLNGTHSLIAYLGALSGAATIPESVGQPSIESAARSVLRNEYLPSISVPAGVDVDAYEEQLFSRWRNTALGHRTSQVGSDGSVKLRQRIPFRHCRCSTAGRCPTCSHSRLPPTCPASPRCTVSTPAPRQTQWRIRPAAFWPAWRRQSRSGQELAERVLGDHHLLGEELAERTEYIERTGQLIDTIHSSGPWLPSPTPATRPPARTPQPGAPHDHPNHPLPAPRRTSEGTEAAVLHGAGDLRIEQKPLRALGPNDVLVEMRSGGICGSDMHYFADGRNGTNVLHQPTVLGHEGAGVVIAAGARPASPRAPPSSSNPPCPAGSAPPVSPGATTFAPPELASVPLPRTGSSPATSWCLRPPSTDCRTPSRRKSGQQSSRSPSPSGPSNAPGWSKGHRVLITGAGPIGLLVSQVAAARGAAEIVVTDVNDDRLAAAAKFGATRTINTAATIHWT